MQQLRCRAHPLWVVKVSVQLVVRVLSTPASSRLRKSKQANARAVHPVCVPDRVPFLVVSRLLGLGEWAAWGYVL